MKLGTGNEYIKLMHAAAQPITIDTYYHKYKTLLYLQEYCAMVALQLFDMTTVMNHYQNDKLRLYVSGLSEARPSVLVGDSILCRYQNCVYRGYVWAVQLEHVVLKFHDSFHRIYIDHSECYIQFVLNRTSFRRMHQALDILMTKSYQQKCAIIGVTSEPVRTNDKLPVLNNSVSTVLYGHHMINGYMMKYSVFYTTLPSKVTTWLHTFVPQDTRHIGIDTEYMWNQYNTNVQLCVIQIAVPRHVLVYHCVDKADMPHLLKLLLETKLVNKYGVGIINDAIVLGASHHIQLQGHIDLAVQAEQLIGKPYTIRSSMKQLAAKLLNIQLDKSHQRSIWNTYQLSDEQISYAASDAVISYMLAVKLGLTTKNIITSVQSVPITPYNGKLTWYNSKLNTEQRLAVTSVLQHNHDIHPYIEWTTWYR